MSHSWIFSCSRWLLSDSKKTRNETNMKFTLVASKTGNSVLIPDTWGNCLDYVVTRGYVGVHCVFKMRIFVHCLICSRQTFSCSNAARLEKYNQTVYSGTLSVFLCVHPPPELLSFPGLKLIPYEKISFKEYWLIIDEFVCRLFTTSVQDSCRLAYTLSNSKLFVETWLSLPATIEWNQVLQTILLIPRVLRSVFNTNVLHHDA